MHDAVIARDFRLGVAKLDREAEALARCLESPPKEKEADRAPVLEDGHAEGPQHRAPKPFERISDREEQKHVQEEGDRAEAGCEDEFLFGHHNLIGRISRKMAASGL